MLLQTTFPIATPPQESAEFRADVIAGLTNRPRAIPARWLYDDTGSRLFDMITDLAEYYPTRVETALLQQRAPAIAALAGDVASIVEFGAGSLAKTPLLLNAVRPDCHVAIDIAGDHLRKACERLAAGFPELDIRPVAADFTAQFALPADIPSPRLGFFPGSTIGNFGPVASVDLLRHFAALLGEGALLLVGLDRIKDVSTLVPAYDDAAGVTAAFNLNLLHRINRELDGDIPVEVFRHRARWNEQASRIEMHLEAERDCAFTVARRNFTMKAGETIHTENSYKYGLRDAHLLLRAGGWTPVGDWADREGLFMLILARALPEPAAP